MFIKMFIVAMVQGITEFLPVSSSGHMVMVERFLKYNPRGNTLEIVLHLATLLAVIVYFNKKLLSLLTLKGGNKNPLLLIIIGTIPAAIVGVLFNDRIESIFDSSSYLTWTFLLNGIILGTYYFAEKYVVKERENSPLVAFLIGIAQVLAILPGISRSGTTITAGRWLKLKREEAFDFSFYLLFPAVLGALLLKIKEVSSLILNGVYIGGFFVAFFFGLLSLYLLKKIVVGGKLYLFGIYTFSLSIVLFIT